MRAWTQIERLMAERGLTGADVARIAGVVPSAVTRWKAGAQIRLDTLSRIAQHFGVSVDALAATPDGDPALPASSRAAATVLRLEARDSQTAYETDRERIARMAEEIEELKRQLAEERSVIGEQRGIIKDLAQTLLKSKDKSK